MMCFFSKQFRKYLIISFIERPELNGGETGSGSRAKKRTHLVATSGNGDLNTLFVLNKSFLGIEPSTLLAALTDYPIRNMETNPPYLCDFSKIWKIN